MAVLALAAFLVETASCARKKFYGENTPRIEVGVGENIDIALEANPTTGYAWAIVKQPDPGIAGFLKSGYEAGDSNLAGAGGHHHFIFRAVGRGTTTIQLDYRRSWEETSPAKSATFTIVIR